MSKLKKIIIGIWASVLLLPVIAFAGATSVDRLTDHIEPLIKTDYIKASRFIATSTTLASYITDSFGIGSTSPSAKLSILGNNGLSTGVLTQAKKHATTTIYIQGGSGGFNTSIGSDPMLQGNGSGGYFVSGNGGGGSSSLFDLTSGNGGSWNFITGNGGLANDACGGCGVMVGGKGGDVIYTLGSGGVASGGSSNISGRNGYFLIGGGNVGIGTTTPSNTLEVVGNLYLAGKITATSTATSTFSGTIISPCFATSTTGGCITSGSGGASLSGGTTNWLTYWTSGTTVGATSSPTVGFIQATSSSDTNYFAGKIGIGTTTPSSKLSVQNSSVSEIPFSAYGTILQTAKVADFGVGTSSVLSINHISTTKTDLRLADYSRPTGFSQLYTRDDEAYSGGEALYINANTFGGGGRIYFGGVTTGGNQTTLYAMDFARVQNWTGVPTVVSQVSAIKSSYCPVVACTVITNDGGPIILDANTAGKGISNNQTITAGNAGFILTSYNNDLKTYKSTTPEAFRFETATTSSKMTTINHTNWYTADSTTVPLMSFTVNGNLGIGSTTPSAKLSIHDKSGLAGTNPLFVIASSTTSSTATTTLFTVAGNGATYILGKDIATSSPIFSVATTSGVIREILPNGHERATGQVPTVSTCGTSPSAITGNDNGFSLTTGSGAYSDCVINFASSWSSPPVCTFGQTSGTPTSINISTTVSTVTIGNTLSVVSKGIAVQCKEYISR